MNKSKAVLEFLKEHDKQYTVLSDNVTMTPRSEINHNINKLGWMSPKPVGTWYGIGDSWARFCHYDAQWCYDYVYTLEYDPKTVLHIKTLDEFKIFAEKYKHGGTDFYFNNYINWEMVSNDFDGIEIYPYRKECRLTVDTAWYYSWDVASGCIWNENIFSLKKIGFWDGIHYKKYI
jgi:hypothetical protein